MRACNKDFESAMRRVVLVALIYLVPSFQALLPVDDPDIWWHLRTGEWIATHGTVPFRDYFSAYGLGKPWIAYSWPFELLVYHVHKYLGLSGIVYFTVAMALLIALSVHQLLRLSRLSVVAEVILTALVLAAMKPLMTPRPWLFTILFFSAEMILIHRARAKSNVRPLCFIPLIFIVWANVHVQFIYGLAALGLLWIESFLLSLRKELKSKFDAPDLPLKAISVIGGLSVIATLVSPYHVLIYRPIVDYIGQTGAFDNIGEFHPMFFRSPQDWIVLGVTLWAAFLLGRRQKWQPFPSLLFVLGVFLGFRARRDVWILLLASACVVADFLGRLRSENQLRFSGRQVVAVLVLVLGSLCVLSVQRRITDDHLQSIVAETYPAGAVAEIRRRQMAGPLFNHLDWGGFLIWSLPEIPVAMDGRTNLYGDQRLESSLKVWQGYPGWEMNPDLRAAALIIADHNRPLTWLLRKDSHYKIAYEDRTAVVFVRSFEVGRHDLEKDRSAPAKP